MSKIQKILPDKVPELVKKGCFHGRYFRNTTALLLVGYLITSQSNKNVGVAKMGY